MLRKIGLLIFCSLIFVGCNNYSNEIDGQENSNMSSLSISDFATTKVIGISKEQVHEILGNNPQNQKNDHERYRGMDLTSIVSSAYKGSMDESISVSYDTYGNVTESYIETNCLPDGFAEVLKRFKAEGHKCTSANVAIELEKGYEKYDQPLSSDIDGYVTSMLNYLYDVVSSAKHGTELNGTYYYEENEIKLRLSIKMNWYPPKDGESINDNYVAPLSA